MDVIKKVVFLAISCMFLGYYLEIETPLTQNIISWKNQGEYFKYNKHNIFFSSSLKINNNLITFDHHTGNINFQKKPLKFPKRNLL